MFVCLTKKPSKLAGLEGRIRSYHVLIIHMCVKQDACLSSYLSSLSDQIKGAIQFDLWYHGGL